MPYDYNPWSVDMFKRPGMGQPVRPPVVMPRPPQVPIPQKPVPHQWTPPPGFMSPAQSNRYEGMRDPSTHIRRWGGAGGGGPYPMPFGGGGISPWYPPPTMPYGGGFGGGFGGWNPYGGGRMIDRFRMGGSPWGGGAMPSFRPPLGNYPPDLNWMD